MINLQLFCGRNVNFNLGWPFSKGGYTYATDGHIAIKIPYVPGNDRLPPVSAYKMDYAPTHDGDWCAVPPYGPLETEQCSHCKGTTFSHECDGCGGEGYIAEDDPCRFCDGEGAVPGGDRMCENCNGTGTAYADCYPSVHFGTTMLSPKLLDKIRTLPKAEIFLPASPTHQVHFRFDGGVGIVMAMKE